MTDTIKKCAICKFSEPSDSGDKWDYAKCHHVASVKESETRWHLGEEASLAYRYCSTMRAMECGKDAKLFEPRRAK